MESRWVNGLQRKVLLLLLRASVIEVNILFLLRGRGAEKEGERESQADFMSIVEPNVLLSLSTLRS